MSDLRPVSDSVARLTKDTFARKFVSLGAWIRPFGKLVYLMPPFVITPEELRVLTHAIHEAIASGEF